MSWRLYISNRGCMNPEYPILLLTFDLWRAEVRKPIPNAVPSSPNSDNPNPSIAVPILFSLTGY